MLPCTSFVSLLFHFYAIPYPFHSFFRSVAPSVTHPFFLILPFPLLLAPSPYLHSPSLPTALLPCPYPIRFPPCCCSCLCSPPTTPPYRSTTADDLVWACQLRVCRRLSLIVSIFGQGTCLRLSCTCLLSFLPLSFLLLSFLHPFMYITTSFCHLSMFMCHIFDTQ